MKFILEGIDGAGKSTLARKIQETFNFMNFDIVHCTRETDNNLEFFKDMIYNLDGRYSDNLIIDRMHLGQCVYQNEDERIDKGWMSDDDILELENCLHARTDMEPVIKIFVDTPIETCLYNCHHNGEDGHYTLEYLRDLREKYLNFIERLNRVSCNKWIIYKNEFLSPEIARNFDYSTLPHIVAVDFDGCLADTEFPVIKDINKKLLYELTDGIYKNSKKILWTNRTDDSLKEALEYLESFGFIPDAVNDNIQEVKDIGLDPRKVYYDIVLDDKSYNCTYKNNICNCELF